MPPPTPSAGRCAGAAASDAPSEGEGSGAAASLLPAGTRSPGANGSGVGSLAATGAVSIVDSCATGERAAATGKLRISAVPDAPVGASGDALAPWAVDECAPSDP